MSKTKVIKQIKVDDLWAKIELEPADTELDILESTVLLVGDSGSGKTTLINNFLKNSTSKQPKPTFALEYSFARKKNTGSSNNSKSVAHIWELGGDVHEPGLLNIPITIKTVRSLSVLLCCDLSKPHNIIQSLQKWISLINDVLSKKMSNLKMTAPKEAATLKESRTTLYSENSDLRYLKLCEVPIYIVACKYDLFKDLGSVEKRTTTQILRFIAHYYGATILTSSAVDSSLRETFKTNMSSISFRAPLRQMIDVASDRPVHVSAGKDSFEFILSGVSRQHDSSGPETQSKGTHESGTSTLFDYSELPNYIEGDQLTKKCWKKLADKLQSALGIPPDEDSSLSSGKQSADEDHESVSRAGAGGGDDHYHDEFPEPDVDEVRSQRNIVLQRYIQEAERKDALQARMLADNDNTGGEGEKEATYEEVDVEKKSSTRERDTTRKQKK